jgi:hypothetical protein
LGKWQTTDPILLTKNLPYEQNTCTEAFVCTELGYPDGWNNFAYVNNHVIDYIDDIGTTWVQVSDNLHKIIDLPEETGSWIKGLTPGTLTRTNIIYVFSNISYGSTTESIQNGIKTVTKSVKFTKTTYSEIEQMDASTGLITQISKKRLSSEKGSGMWVRTYKWE